MLSGISPAVSRLACPAKSSRKKMIPNPIRRAFSSALTAFSLYRSSMRVLDIFPVGLDVLYALYLAFLLVRGIRAQKERVAETGRTREYP